MPKLYVHYKNHLDLTWRRPRYTAGNTEGWKIIPYAELQERQIDRGFDFIREGGSYSLEQTISLREYLERNPDCEDEVREWLKDGRLTVHGGGESVVDYNLPDGESIIRNHLYSRLWLKNRFDYRPRLADCPDTFGLSANLPEMFRQLGYPGILTFHRVFKNHKPYWKGLSGKIIALDTRKVDIPAEYYDDCVKCRVCTICKGDGCPACEGSGVYLNPQPEDLGEFDSFAQLRDFLMGDECDVGCERDAAVSFAGEEAMAAEDAVKSLQRIADECGYELVFTDPESLSLECSRALLENIDHAPEDRIDSRIEGNPVASGCYTARIKIKQENRRCESALRTAEHLAAAAALEGLAYPAKTLEKNWIKLAFLQFHDAIPASHSDDAYTELLEAGRQLRASVSRIIQKSAKKLIEKAEITGGEGIPFAVFNPLEFDVTNARLTGTVHCESYVTGCKIIAPDGLVYPVLSVKRTTVPGHSEALVEFIGSLPAFGYAVMRFVPDDAELPEPKEMRRGFVMENPYLRITFGEYSVREVYDKDRKCIIAAEGSFAPWLTDDAGHPWGRTNTIQYEERADVGDYCENMLPPHEMQRKITYEKRDGVQIARIYVNYARYEKQIRSLDWCAEFTLAENSRELDVKIKTSLDARDIRLSTHLVLPKPPVDNLLEFEIPLGAVRRGCVEELNQQLGYADEWAALRYVSADLGDYKVTLCNNGTPAHTLHRDFCNTHITAALLRTPTQMCCGFGVAGAIDTSVHEFRFTLAADNHPMDAYRRGMTLNTEFPSLFVREQEGELPAVHSFLHLPDNLPMLALKGAENGDGFVVRYLGVGEIRTLVFDSPVLPAGLLEDCEGKELHYTAVNPWEIRTFRISAENMKRSCKNEDS